MTHANANTSKAGRTFLAPLGFQKRVTVISLNQFPDNPLLVQNVLIGQQMGQVPLFCTASSLVTNSSGAPKDEQESLYNLTKSV